MNKIQYIKKYVNTESSEKDALFLNGLLWCLSRDDIQVLFEFFITKDLKIKKLFFNRILYEIKITKNNNYEKLFNTSVEVLDKIEEYPKRESVSKFIIGLVANLDEDSISLAFKKFVLSRFRNDRKRALKLFREYNLTQEMELIEKAWQKYGDDEFLELIVNHSSKKYLMSHSDKIYEVFESYDEDDLSIFFEIKILRNNFLSRTYFSNTDKIKPLKISDPISYIFIVKEAGQNINSEYAIKIFNEYKYSQKYLVVWYGQMKMWDVLIGLRNSLINKSAL